MVVYSGWSSSFVVNISSAVPKEKETNSTSSSATG